MLGLSYPIVVHVCVLFGRVTIAIYWLAILLVLFSLRAAGRSGTSRVWAMAGLSAAAAVVLSAATDQQFVVYLPPVAVNAVLLATFLASLRGGDTPLITRLALLMDPDLSEAGRRYTRRVTAFWAGYFLVMTVLAVAFAVFASMETWSLVANCLHYVLVPLLLAGEFAVRRRVLGSEVADGFGTFVKRLFATVT